jgi:hypothetical protein
VRPDQGCVQRDNRPGCVGFILSLHVAWLCFVRVVQWPGLGRG